jgi:hypothetical protein
VPSTSPVVAIPDRLVSLVAELRADGLRQPAVRVERERWLIALGAHAALLRGIPAELDRVSTRRFVLARPRSERGALAGFIVSQIWGFGSNGYGPHRLGEALAYPGLGRILLRVRAQLADGDPVGAFRSLCVGSEIPYVGMAFGSKFLYFADPHGRALILDSLLRVWLAEHTGVRLRGGRDEREYAMWLLIAEQWAKALRITSDELELVMFTDALPADSTWRPASVGDHPERPATPIRRARRTRRSVPSTRVLLLGCVKRKLTHRAPAQDLYVSPLWNGRRAYAQASGYPWLILSAKYGVLDPKKPIAPYDVALADLPVRARRAWGEQVVVGLQERFRSLDGMAFEMHAGEAYRTAIAPRLRELGASVEQPLLGLTMGRQLSWYRSHTAASQSGAGSVKRRRHATPAEVRHALHAIEENPQRVAASDWPAGLQGLTQPGLYSWWVDTAGAIALTQGLGQTIKAGRIYAGQTGATKWPSGIAGAMTLAKRIGSNHLNGRIRGSTFRLTLAAILAEPELLTITAPGQLDRDSERRLSQWIRAHLHVAVHPFSDRDALLDLEKHVLDKLDPPLNLDGRPTTAIRVRLTSLRRLLAAAEARAN